VTVYTELLPETPIEGMRLGRHVEHDERSKHYALDTSGLTISSVRHTRHTPVFDQGDLGCCTGCAMCGALATDPFFATETGVPFTLDTAIGLYGAATRLDDVPGIYPPADTGSTGVAVAKAAKNRNWISGYLHTFSLNDALKALSTTPIIIGISWYSSFDRPDSNGVVAIKRGATVRGGHEICVDELVVQGSSISIGFSNSWGTTWGKQGRGYMTANTFATLLARRGDVVVPVPLSAAPPVPSAEPHTPAPIAISADDLNLWVAMQAWAKAKGLV